MACRNVAVPAAFIPDDSGGTAADSHRIPLSPERTAQVLHTSIAPGRQDRIGCAIESLKVICTDPERLDIDFIYDFLSRKSYWTLGRTRENVERCMRYSLCFGMFSTDVRRIGFSMVVLDCAIFPWVCNAFIDEWFGREGIAAKAHRMCRPSFAAEAPQTDHARDTIAAIAVSTLQKTLKD